MSLYLCVFNDEEEIDGVDVGRYADFNCFREIVVQQLEGGKPGSKFPTLILHSDSDGQWGVEECIALENELRSIGVAFRNLPPAELNADWQKTILESLGLHPTSLYESLIDVNGEPLIERMVGLCRLAKESGQPIIFQ